MKSNITPNNIQWLRKECHTCYHRHRCRHDFDKIFCKNGMYLDSAECRYWRLGKCLLCKHLDASEDEWYQRGCEAQCLGGCKQFKRNWRSTLRWICKRIFILDGKVFKR